MDSEDSLHKKPRMDDNQEDKDVVEDVEPIKIVSFFRFPAYALHQQLS